MLIVNYYDFFVITIKLDVDLQKLKQQFYENSKKYHPDFFTLQSTEVQNEALQKSTLNNQAFNTLANFDLRVKYFLELHDQISPEGENQIPQDFLIEMMELNEQIMELEFDYDQNLYNQIQNAHLQFTNQLRESLLPLEGKEARDFSEQDWNLLKDFYLKNQYLKRLSTNLQKLRPA